MELRPYQVQAGKAIVNFIEKDTGHGVVAACPAAGKSILIARTAEFLHKRNKRVLVLADRSKLIKQNYSKFSNLDLVGIVSAGMKEYDYGKPITIGGIQTLYNKSEQIGSVNWILIDECHSLGNNFDSNTRYHQLLREYPNARILGFSGTPYSLSEGAISWGKIIYEITYKELLELKYVTPITNKIPFEPNLDEVKKVAGEYNLSQLDNVMREPTLIELTARKTAEYIRAADRRKTLGFCVSIEHATEMGLALQKHGLNVDMVHGEMSEDQREMHYDWFQNGSTEVLLNVELITKGVDFPCIDCIAFYRPTESMALWEQAISRGIRLYEGKEYCLLLDFTGNLRKFGTLGNPIWKYFGSEKKKIGNALKICPACEEEVNIGRETCNHCGYVFLKSDVARELKHKAEADLKSSLEAPHSPVKIWSVNKILYSHHTTAKNAHYLRIEYICGRASVSEYMPFGDKRRWAIEKCIRFIKPRANKLPHSIKEALELCKTWREPAIIKVQPQKGNPKYYELMEILKWRDDMQKAQSNAN